MTFSDGSSYKAPMNHNYAQYRAQPLNPPPILKHAPEDAGAFSGKVQVQTWRFTSCTIATWLQLQLADRPEGTTLSLAINHTFMQVGVYPSVKLNGGVDAEDNGNVPKSPLMG